MDLPSKEHIIIINTRRNVNTVYRRTREQYTVMCEHAILIILDKDHPITQETEQKKRADVFQQKKTPDPRTVTIMFAY